jgi:hypothetical protein
MAAFHIDNVNRCLPNLLQWPAVSAPETTGRRDTTRFGGLSGLEGVVILARKAGSLRRPCCLGISTTGRVGTALAVGDIGWLIYISPRAISSRPGT